MKSKPLLNFMLNDHAEIHKFFIEIQENIGKDDKLLLKAIDEFEWKIQKHYFAEENAIFNTYIPKENTTGNNMVPKVIKQHKEILKQLKLFKKSIIKKKNFDFDRFLKLLKSHKNFEESNLYPKLEKELSESDKNMIIKRINEIH